MRIICKHNCLYLVKELINLCLTSAQMRARVCSYLYSPNFIRYFETSIKSLQGRSLEDYEKAFKTFGT